MFEPHVTHPSLSGLIPDRGTLLVGALVVNTQIAITLAYLLFVDATVTDLRYLVYPWLWINAAGLAIWKTDLVPAGRAIRHRSLAIAAGYFLLLLLAGGLIGPTGGFTQTLFGDGGHSHEAMGLSVHWLTPGMGPAVLYQGDVIRAAFIPYEVIGYAGLAYLVYAGILETAGSTLSGVLGVFSCVSCAWPVVGGAVTTLFGSGSAVAVAATSWPYDIATVVFLSAVVLLYWRPSW